MKRIKLSKIQLVLVLVCCLLLSCGKRTPFSEAKTLKTTWLTDYRIFYRNSILTIQAKVAPKIITNFNFTDLKIKTTNSAKPNSTISQAKISYQKKMKDSFEIAFSEQFPKQFFQLILVKNQKTYYSQWKRAVLLALIPKPITKFVIKDDGVVSLNFKNREQYAVRLYNKLELLPIAEFIDSFRATKLADYPLLIRYYDKYGNESDGLTIFIPNDSSQKTD